MDPRNRELLKQSQGALLTELDVDNVLFFMHTNNIFSKKLAESIRGSCLALNDRRLMILDQIKSDFTFEALYQSLMHSDQRELAALLRPLASPSSVSEWKTTAKKKPAMESSTTLGATSVVTAAMDAGSEENKALASDVQAALEMVRDREIDNGNIEDVMEGEGLEVTNEGKEESVEISSDEQVAAQLVGDRETKTVAPESVKTVEVSEKTKEGKEESEHQGRGAQVVVQKGASNRDHCIVDFGNLQVSVDESQMLGDGGFAFVYVGKNIITNEKIAVKVLRNPTAGKKELNILKEIQEKGGNPNFVLPLGGKKIGDQYYIALELLGPSVLDILNDLDLLPPRETGILACQMVSALAFLHDRGICHGDVKPDNILTRRGVQVNQKRKVIGIENPVFVLLDFNTARKMKPKQTEVEVIGTTVYRAPEIVIGIRWDKKIDIFALGMVLAECLDGELLIDFDVDDYHHLTIKERKEHIMLFDKAMGPLSGKLLEMSSIREIVKFGVEYKHPVIEEKSKIQNKLTSLVDGDTSLNISNLVLTMLQVDPACRPTAKELLDSDVMKRLKKLDVVQDGEGVQEKVEMENGDEVQEFAEKKDKNKERKELIQGAENGEMELMEDEPKEESTEEGAVWNDQSDAEDEDVFGCPLLETRDTDDQAFGLRSAPNQDAIDVSMNEVKELKGAMEEEPVEREGSEDDVRNTLMLADPFSMNDDRVSAQERPNQDAFDVSMHDVPAAPRGIEEEVVPPPSKRHRRRSRFYSPSD